MISCPLCASLRDWAFKTRDPTELEFFFFQILLVRVPCERRLWLRELRVATRTPQFWLYSLRVLQFTDPDEPNLSSAG